jgi:hypothetical protein
MPKILSANRTNVLVNGEAVEGLQEISYRTVTSYTDVDAIGARERIGVVHGPTKVVGSLRVRSVVDSLEQLLRDQAPFQIFAAIQNEGDDEVIHEISLEECFLHGKSYAMGAGNVAETIYEFSATREQG